jgi:carbonic anhydrase/acetyltransferase-like protein (isoleucine patch superfamily)
MIFLSNKRLVLSVLLNIFLLTVLSQRLFGDEYLVNELFYSDSDPSVNTRTSEHFRIVWGDDDQSGLMTEDYVQGNLSMFEDCWEKYIVEIGFYEPSESAIPELRDGNKYKVNIIVGLTGLEYHEGGGCWLGYEGSSGFGYVICDPYYMRYDPPSGATPHEFAHVCQVHAPGGFTNNPATGFFWEAHANWMMLQFLDTYPTVWLINQRASEYLANGRHYYDSWQIFEHFKDTPEYSYAFVNSLWNDSLPGEYILDAMVRLDPTESGDNELKIRDEFGKMARRNVTWDYERQAIFQSEDTHPDKYRSGRVVLERISGRDGWWRVPDEMAPQQCGYNIIPLELIDRTYPTHEVTVNFRGYVDPFRGSDWRSSLVAVSDSGGSRYSRPWNNGLNSIVLTENENGLYLVVIAVPKFMPILVEDDYRGLKKAQFPYEVFVDGAIPNDLPRANPSVPGHSHSNGGGFVANTAYVESSAYVGPDAQVLDYAQVLGNARIEDYALVEDYATVMDNAVISGHGWIKDSAQVLDYGKVRNFGKLESGSIVSGNGKVIEHGTLLSNCHVSDEAVVKGISFSWSETIAGSAVVDGDYANNLNLTKGVWFLWLVNTQTMADNAEDLENLYACYDFETSHPYLAWDKHGAIHGYLNGEPEIEVDDNPIHKSVLALNGADQYADLPDDVSDMRDITVCGWIKWSGGAANQKIFQFGDGFDKWMYLTPKNDAGKTEFAITTTGISGTQVLQKSSGVPTGTWTHIAVTLEGNIGVLYINGVPVYANSITINPDQLRGPDTFDGGCDNYLGRGYNPDEYFSGRLDDVRVYSRSLSALEIADIYAVEPVDYTPLVDLDAADLALGILSNWTNNGSVGGSFGNEGTNPTVETVDGQKAVTFDGNDKMLASFTAPEGITGNGDYTAAVWAYNPSIAWEECMVNWAHRGGPDGTCAQINYGGSPDWGAVTHWGWPDMGFGTEVPAAGQWHHIAVTFDGSIEKVYVNGQLTNSESKTLNIYADDPVYLGCAVGNTLYFSGSLASVQIYDVVLDETMITNLAGLVVEPDEEPPTPNPAEFSIVPFALSEIEVSMAAVEGADACGIVDYYFEEITGKPGGNDSGWQYFRNYVDSGLAAATQYQYRVLMRDIHGHVTQASEALSVWTLGVSEPTADVNGDGDVDIDDFADIAAQWLAVNCQNPQWCDGADLTTNGIVDLDDLVKFLESWTD